MRVAFVLDRCDRDAMGHAITTGGITAEDVRGLTPAPSSSKPLSVFAPYEYILEIWPSEPDRLIVNPIHHMPGLITWALATCCVNMVKRR